MHADVHYHPTKFEVKIQLVYMEKQKEQIILWGRMN
jgi:hypothetical protein